MSKGAILAYDKLDRWAEDKKLSLEKEIKDLDAEIKLKKSEARRMLNLQDKVAVQRTIKELEKRRNKKRQNLFETQDNIDEEKEKLLSKTEQSLDQQISEKELFTVIW